VVVDVRRGSDCLLDRSVTSDWVLIETVVLKRRDDTNADFRLFPLLIDPVTVVALKESRLNDHRIADLQSQSVTEADLEVVVADLVAHLLVLAALDPGGRPLYEWEQRIGAIVDEATRDGRWVIDIRKILETADDALWPDAVRLQSRLLAHALLECTEMERRKAVRKVLAIRVEEGSLPVRSISSSRDRVCSRSCSSCRRSGAMNRSAWSTLTRSSRICSRSAEGWSDSCRQDSTSSRFPLSRTANRSLPAWSAERPWSCDGSHATCGEQTAGLRVDLLDAILGELKQVLAVEGRSRMRGDINRAQRLSAGRIEGVQLVSASKPDLLTVIRNPMHVVDTGKGAILTDDFGCCSIHASILVTREWSGE
jgi:hypothetical protein